MTRTLAAELESLSTARVRGHRNSNQTVKQGLFVLEQKNGLKALGDDVWDFLEQLATAAIDIGQLALATDCIQRLGEQYPDSPRVALLQGLVLESKDLTLASKYYRDLLEEDESNPAIWKRQISILKQQGKIDQAVLELSKFVDTFSTDVEGWLELADLYAGVYQYQHSLQALSHALLLLPQNPFHTLRFAETAYTAADIPLALKMFLRVVELLDAGGVGVERRAWFGVKLCTRRLLSAEIESDTPKPKEENLKLLDELATEKISDAYKGGVPGRSEVLKWLGSSS